jgi:hypothetical protein
MNGPATHNCPLCGLDFSGEACHSSCPMSRGCRMVKCPRCSYEMVDEGIVANFVRGLIDRFRREESAR